MIQIHPLGSIPEVRPSDDLARLLADAIEAAAIVPGSFDVLAVTQKIVSKAEGRFVDLATVRPGPEAMRLAGLTRKDPRLVELILAESSHVIRAVPHILITRHRSGHAMANAGIDQSNIGPGSGERVLLLPVDSDASAERLRQTFATLWPTPPAVLIMDSFGRPWRHGVTCVALGASGLPSLVDRRGECDRDGRTLEVTQIAVADMVATAAGLVTGEGAEGMPAALVRGLHWTAASQPASALIRPVEQDLFR
ncbi:coenzyme F420-0:L-glutamate ligase [Sphingobium phenoxybenzoativorans]|jgi:coenzyme F420-0:L-glutamate ligase/coenzyme F420-1:gamma-L-glutamate ligase|uniref:Coenzyme F420-0:L-glutamate ligase n=1 Tax=Sphingobium phenoxybenzoativorans TaxID=1592790 RepID=A0A975K999_9SPHN|nr:coenzyme F420-0:L-glutamate ligase [Sphingobium phenoxybenzoativorans]QUT07176.1 coenzyme F420-0:L-glutamate ligase [Sphingobium phenoxybenzoativorans]